MYRYIINADTFHPQKLDPVMYLHIGRISAAKSKDTEQCFKCYYKYAAIVATYAGIFNKCNINLILAIAINISIIHNIRRTKKQSFNL